MSATTEVTPEAIARVLDERATTEVTPEAINRILDKHSGLTREGLVRPSYVPPREWLADLPAQREALRSSVREIETCVLALSQATPTSRGRLLTSYTGKHAVERWAERLGWRAYISNGAFIVGALLSGFRIVGPPTLNPKFNILPAFLRETARGRSLAREAQGAKEVLSTRLSCVLGLRRLQDEMVALREPLARHAAGVIPIGGRPSEAELRASAEALREALRDLVATAEDDLSPA